MDWLTEARELSEAGQPFALATVVRRVAPASAQPGAKALIQRDGTMRGWVGGSCAQPAVIGEALRALREGAPRLLRLGQMPGASQPGQDDISEYPMTCHSGGALEILIEPVLPPPRLAIVGETPVAETLATLAVVMGYRVDRHERAGALAGQTIPPFVVAASMGVDDEEALLAALPAGVPYVALVASPKRAAAVRETLLASGVSGDALSRLHAPAGLDIGARTQEEIALSIMAEIAQTRATLAADIAGDMGEPESPSGMTRGSEAIDPVCGMTVTIGSARHSADYAGKTWYFCCGGCKAEFTADPASFAAA